jgi:hypothetical protein
MKIYFISFITVTLLLISFGFILPPLFSGDMLEVSIGWCLLCLIPVALFYLWRNTVNLLIKHVKEKSQ